MEPNAPGQHTKEELDRLIETLPEELQSLCSSGKSVLDLAHLVKNILQMVSGSVEIMQLSLERRDYDRVSKSWAIFEPNFMRLKKFVLDLIKFTKQYPLHLESCDVNEAVGKAVRICEGSLKGYAVKVQFRPGSGICAAMLDADRIAEIAGNLITHAVDNLPEHTGTIIIRTAFLEGSKEIELKVMDEAPALPLDVIQLLRYPAERASNMYGTGYEIPLAALFTQQHGGYLEIDSTPPNGNSVHVYLPAKFP